MMNHSNYELVTDLLKEFRQEYDTLQEQIEEAQVQIKEKDRYIQSFFNKQDDEFKIFSPRNAEDIYRDEIAQAGAEKDALQLELNQWYHEQNILRSRIEKLEKVVMNKKEYHDDIEDHQQNLAILNIQEEDRQRIARDLHDISLQNLAHLVHKIELSSMFIDQDPLRAKLELAVISKNLKSVIDEIRNIIFDLRPMSFDDLGLKSAFEQLLQKINSNNLYEIDAEIDNVSCENDLILATVFRIVQECLVNITKHAEADKILFHCKQIDNICTIDIKDNGNGFTKDEVVSKQQERHFGITLVKERISLLGGNISINSEKEIGTHIHIEVPLI